MIAERRDVLFLCIFVPPGPSSEIDEAVAFHGLRGRLIEPERRHISLFGFGQPSRAIVEQIDRAMASIKPKVRPFGVVFEQLVIGARQSLLRPGEGERIEGLERYSDQCLIAFAKQGLRLSWESSSGPHVTVGYDGVDRATQLVCPLGWLVEDVALVISEQGRHRYRLLRRFALDAAADGRSCQ